MDFDTLLKVLAAALFGLIAGWAARSYFASREIRRSEPQEEAARSRLDLSPEPEPAPAPDEDRPPPPKPAPSGRRRAFGVGSVETPRRWKERQRSALRVNQWIKDRHGEISKLGESLEPSRNYSYCFEIAVKKRAGADTEEFQEPADLGRPGAVVELQVRCALLLAEEGFVRRPVDYQLGRGLAPEEFRLFAEPGKHDLSVQLLQDGRPVYSHVWTISVAEAASDDAPDAATPHETPGEQERSLPVNYEVRAAMPALRASKGWADKVTLEVAGRPPIRGEDADREKLVHLGVDARKTLTAFSRRRSPDADGKLDWETVWKELLYPMIDWGRTSTEAVLGGRNLHQLLHDKLAGLPLGSRLHIDSSPGSFPWQWLYTGPHPPEDPPALGSQKCQNTLMGFWGMRFELEVLPYGDYDRTLVQAILTKPDKAKVFSVVNTSADQNAAPLHADFLEKMATWPSVETVFCKDSARMEELLKKAIASAGDSCHLLYVYAHHTPGASLSVTGYYDFGDSTLYLKGKNQDPVTRSDVENRVFKDRKFLPEAAPLVILNACGTAAGGDYFPSNLLPFFVIQANAPAALGTVAEINTMAAHHFGAEFIERWLKGAKACRALAEIRREWLFNKGNPYALYYTICGDGDVCLR